MPTGISYVDETWNPVVGCTKCSPGCLHCYAEELHNMRHRAYLADKKVPKQYAKPFSKIQLFSERLKIPLHWRKPRRILVPSMGDLFHKDVPFEYADEVLDTMFYADWHTYLILTKRVKRMLEYFKHLDEHIDKDFSDALSWSENPSKHIHLGVTICNQAEADEILPIALQIPGFDWVSFEPLLSNIDFSDYMGEYLGSETCSYGDMHKKRECECTFLGNLKFAVVGCESINGKAGRFRELEGGPWLSLQSPEVEACFEEAVSNIVQQCKAAGVGCYVKQIPINGKVEHDISKFPEDLQVRDEI